MNADGAVRVFISYSHDSLEHSNKVLLLADRLRSEGVDAHIDQYEANPPEGWYRWMENQIELANYVLVVCSHNYYLRFRGHEQHGRGLGATWEGTVITAELYDQGGKNEKFIPVVIVPKDREYIPAVIRANTHYDLSRADEYERLYRRLTEQPEVQRPELGKIVRLPVRRPNTERLPVSPSGTYLTRQELFREVGRLLDENGASFEAFGPHSAEAKRNPLTDAVHIWRNRKRDTIIPNNKTIIRLMRMNNSLLTESDRAIFLRFQTHALAFEDNVDGAYGGDVVPRFPAEFRQLIDEGRGNGPIGAEE